MRLHCHCGGEVVMERKGQGVVYQCTNPRCGAFSTQTTREQAKREWEKNQEEPPHGPGPSKPA
jgi:hypothetical protein